MTQAEFTTFMIDAMATAGVNTASVFTLVFGYLAGLYFFIWMAPLFVRMLTFLFFTVCLVWSWSGIAGVISINIAIFSGAQAAISRGEQFWRLTEQQAAFWFSFNQVGLVVCHITFILTWVALAYGTFFFRWQKAKRTADQ